MKNYYNYAAPCQNHYQEKKIMYKKKNMVRLGLDTTRMFIAGHQFIAKYTVTLEVIMFR